MLDKKTTDLLHIQWPIIMAPMFLVTNEAMLQAAMQAGIMGVLPSLNYRKEGELESLLKKLTEYKTKTTGNFGVNLIVQQSNPLYHKHLKTCIEQRVPFFITSLGSPKEVIQEAHSYGAQVFCDVTNMAHAKKCYELNCDGFIAVGQGAGGHAGPNPLQVLIPSLKTHFPDKPIIAAGGIVSGAGLLSVQALGASGVSIGTRFIASTECEVNKDYKNAIVQFGMDNIVMTEKLSGTPCTIIDTPAAKKMGYTQNWIERLLSKNAKTKKYFKMLVQVRGMKKLEQSLLPNNYLTLWCAGKSVELIHEIKPITTIVSDIEKEYKEALYLLCKQE
ncbi:MAG: nitronate monooxygenase [Bacteroidetes bacterium]|nr:nitronate monooxygenase [Bacteroidota bacterium]